jgi:hypothetical protein
MQELQDDPIEPSEGLDFLTLEAGSPPASAPNWQPIETSPTTELAVLPPLNPVLAKALPKLTEDTRRSAEKLACATCPAAMWMTGATTQAFCQIMRVVAWSKDGPTEIEECSGRLQAIEALQESH